jgi:tetratricopeptide (TPR) repeat protein
MSPSTYRNLALALAGSDIGALRKASNQCRSALRKTADDPRLLRLAGLIECRLGNNERAVKCIAQALAIEPDSAELHCDLAKVLAAQKKHAESIVALNRAIALKPDFAEAHFCLGTVLMADGDDDGAIRAYTDAIAINPNYAEALNSLGVVLKNRGAVADAAGCFAKAIAARPDYPLPLNNLGLMSFSAGQIDAAENLYRRALALKADYPDALNNLGMVLYKKGLLDESADLYRKALALRPDNPNALSNLGLVLHQQGAFAESLALYRKALAANPHHPESLNNLGNALAALGRLPEAIAAYEKALTIKVDHPEYQNNRAMALLAAGRFDEGWPAYEWRWQTSQFATTQARTAKPLWRGEPAEGRVLLIRAEQGFGDTLQFCRYASMAAARGLRVVLEVQPELVRLLGSLKGVSRVIGRGEPLPEPDYHCPMMSLPAAFKTRLDSVPAEVPYLAVDAELIGFWRDRMPPTGDGRLNVGLAWAGKPRVQSPDLIAVDRRRSLAPPMLHPLRAIAGVRFFSLQKDRPAPLPEFGMIDLMNECRDFADTAALVANLDLIISVDTAVVHLAGALGKPVWMLNRFDSCWRWLRDRDTSPWYPTLRIFRQPKPGDWQSVVLQVREELGRMATAPVG